jgi:hypothetical protein
VTSGIVDPTGRLGAVRDRVSEMESALATTDLEAGTASANAIVAATTALLDELDLDPIRDRDRDADLISALRVYRNAALVFRRISGASAEPDPSLRPLCAALIEQGHHHLRALQDDASGHDE